MDTRCAPLEFSPKFGGALELVIVHPAIAYRLDQDPYDLDSTATESTSQYSEKPRLTRLERLRDWWEEHVSMIIPPGSDIRDHFALERTYLDHLRTSVALATVSVVVSQIYTLELGSSDPSGTYSLGLQRIGKPVSCGLLCWAMVSTVIGAIRFMRIQEALVKGKPTINSGWELHIEGLGVLFIVCVIFITVLAQN